MTREGKEKRSGTRVEFATKIRIKTGSSEILAEGDSRDLSLSGIYVKTGEPIETGADCRVEIVLTGMVEAFSLKMNGKVVRRDENGIAIAFAAMDLDTYTHLKNIVKYNAPDPDHIL